MPSAHQRSNNQKTRTRRPQHEIEGEGHGHSNEATISNTTDTELGLETLSDVAGSSLTETGQDEEWLRAAGWLQGDLPNCYFGWKGYSAKIDEAWARAGVHCYTRFSDPNTYTINGETMLHSRALQYLRHHHA